MTGCTGRGKSTFCNFLSRSNKFKPEALPDSETGWGDFGGWGAAAADLTGTQCHVVEDLLGEVTVRIIDLPGYLATHNRTGNDKNDLAKDGKMVLDEFANALTLARGGIDAIFIALRAAERYTREEELLMEFISHLQLWDHCILLFTHGDKAGKDEACRYQQLHVMIKSPALPSRCPVLHKMLQFVNNRFVIVESVHCKGDQKYYHSKVKELCGAIEVVRSKTGPAIGHPLLKLARSAFEASQIKLDMQEMLDEMNKEKGKIQEELMQAQIEREKLEKDYNCLQAELEREKAEKTGGTPQLMRDEEALQNAVLIELNAKGAKLEREKADKTGATPQSMKDEEGLQDAVPMELNSKDDDKQDVAATVTARAALRNWMQNSPSGHEQVAADTYAQLSMLADDRGKMMNELNGLMQQLRTGIGLAFKRRIAERINDILRRHNVEASGDHSIIVSESNERDRVAQREDASRQQDQRRNCTLF